MKIPKRMWISGLAGAAIFGTAAIVYFAMRPADATVIDPTDRTLVRTGKAVYANYCASCHGSSLQGQPDWRKRMPNGLLPAPPHDETGHTWHHPDELLIDIVKNGLVPGRTAPAGYAGDMPAYGGILADEEIVAVLAYIKSTWPPDVLKAQEKVTRQQRN